MIPIHFAPLQGYTDAVYRRVHADVFGGVEAYYTPFVRLEKEGFRKKELRDIAPAENNEPLVIPQLIASTPEEFRQITSLFLAQGYRRADINLGCPFPMQVRQHRGAGILPFPEEVKRLLRTVDEFPELQFSVKMRLGWQQPDEWMALLPFLNELPLQHITLHPRIGTQQYKGTTDSDRFAYFQQRCQHPLIYNGDLATRDDIRFVTDRFPQLQGVMLGRGLLAHPWLAAEYVTGNTFTPSEVNNTMHRFHTLLLDEYGSRLEGGDHQILSKMKTLWDYLMPDADKKLRKKILKSTTLAGYGQAVRDLLCL